MHTVEAIGSAYADPNLGKGQKTSKVHASSWARIFFIAFFSI